MILFLTCKSEILGIILRDLNEIKEILFFFCFFLNLKKNVMERTTGRMLIKRVSKRQDLLPGRLGPSSVIYTDECVRHNMCKAARGYKLHLAVAAACCVRRGDTAWQQGFIISPAVVEVVHYLSSDSRHSRQRRAWEDIV